MYDRPMGIAVPVQSQLKIVEQVENDLARTREHLADLENVKRLLIEQPHILEILDLLRKVGF